jgi:mono/diheme cytochrome c family protein
VLRTGLNLAVLAAAALAVPGTAPATAAGGAPCVPPAEAPQASGKAIFEGKGNCFSCHGRDAKGTPLGPDLTDGEWLNGSGTVAGIADVVRSGVARPKKYPAPMPPMGGARLSGPEIEAVSKYVYDLSQPAAAR